MPKSNTFEGKYLHLSPSVEEQGWIKIGKSDRLGMD
jgi:hypothetical protein